MGWGKGGSPAKPGRISEPKNPSLDGPDSSIDDPLKTATGQPNTPNIEAHPAYSLQSPLPEAQGIASRIRDSQNTRSRHDKAVQEFEDSIESARSHWKTFQIPDLDVVGGSDPVGHLQDKIMNTLDARKAQKKSWIEQCFAAISPFAKNILRIAKEGQAV